MEDCNTVQCCPYCAISAGHIVQYMQQSECNTHHNTITLSVQQISCRLTSGPFVSSSGNAIVATQVNLFHPEPICFCYGSPGEFFQEEKEILSVTPNCARHLLDFIYTEEDVSMSVCSSTVTMCVFATSMLTQEGTGCIRQTIVWTRIDNASCTYVRTCTNSTYTEKSDTATNFHPITYARS